VLEGAFSLKVGVYMYYIRTNSLA